MSVEYTKKFLKRLPENLQKLFKEPTERADLLNIFKLNLKPKISAVATVINPGEEGHVPGNKHDQANAV